MWIGDGRRSKKYQFLIEILKKSSDFEARGRSARPGIEKVSIFKKNTETAPRCPYTAEEKNTESRRVRVPPRIPPYYSRITFWTFIGIMFCTDLEQRVAYALPPGDVPGGQGRFISMDLQARHMPLCRSTPTSLPDPLHLALLGKDDGSLHPNSLK